MKLCESQPRTYLEPNNYDEIGAKLKRSFEIPAPGKGFGAECPARSKKGGMQVMSLDGRQIGRGNAGPVMAVLRPQNSASGRDF